MEVGQALGLHHQTVQRCVERAVAEDPMAALDDRPRPGREPSITLEAKALVDVVVAPEGERAGLPARIADHAAARPPRSRAGPAEGHPYLADLRRARCAKILDSEEVKPHKVRYYLWPSAQASIFLSSVKSAKEPKTTASVTKRGSMRSYQQHDRRSAN